MIYGKLVQTSVPSIQSEKDAMLEALESELNYYNNLFLNESGYVDESTRMVLEAKREVLQEAVGAALIAAIIAAITALIALIIKGTKAVTQKAVEVVKNTSNKNDHVEELKKCEEKTDNKNKETPSSRDTNINTSSTSKKEDVKKDEDMERAKAYYNKFVEKVMSSSLKTMANDYAYLSSKLEEYLNFDKEEDYKDLYSPFFDIDPNQFLTVEFLIKDLTKSAKEALSGQSKNSSKEEFDYIMYLVTPANVISLVVNERKINIRHDITMGEGLKIYSKELRTRGSILTWRFKTFVSYIRGNDVNTALNYYMNKIQRSNKMIQSLESPLKELKSVFEGFKNKYKTELNDKLDKAEGKAQFEKTDDKKIKQKKATKEIFSLVVFIYTITHTKYYSLL